MKLFGRPVKLFGRAVRLFGRPVKLFGGAGRIGCFVIYPTRRTNTTV